MASNDREGERLHLYLNPETAIIFNDAYNQFEADTHAGLSRQKFIIKLIKDYVSSKKKSHE